MAKNYSIDVDPKKVRGVNISRYSDGYNYASLNCKMADSEYMSISYEWKGNDIPEMAMNIMDIMRSLGAETASLEDVCSIERAAAYFTDIAAKMKEKMPPKKDDEPMDDEEDEEDMDGKKKQSKKKKKC